MNDVQLAKELSDHKHRIESLEHRMTDAEAVISEIHAMSKALEVLIYKVNNTDKNVEKLARDVETLKAEPSDRLKQIKTAVIVALASSIITSIVSGVVYASTILNSG